MLASSDGSLEALGAGDAAGAPDVVAEVLGTADVEVPLATPDTPAGADEPRPRCEHPVSTPPRRTIAATLVTTIAPRPGST